MNISSRELIAGQSEEKERRIIAMGEKVAKLLEEDNFTFNMALVFISALHKHIMDIPNLKTLKELK